MDNNENNKINKNLKHNHSHNNGINCQHKHNNDNNNHSKNGYFLFVSFFFQLSFSHLYS